MKKVIKKTTKLKKETPFIHSMEIATSDNSAYIPKTTIDELHTSFGSEDMTKVVEKINEIIKKLNGN